MGIVKSGRPGNGLAAACRVGRYANQVVSPRRRTTDRHAHERLVIAKLNAQQPALAALVGVFVEHLWLRVIEKPLEAHALELHATKLGVRFVEDFRRGDCFRLKRNALIDAHAAPAQSYTLERAGQRRDTGAGKVDPRRHLESFGQLANVRAAGDVELRNPAEPMRQARESRAVSRTKSAGGKYCHVGPPFDLRTIADVEKRNRKSFRELFQGRAAGHVER